MSSSLKKLKIKIDLRMKLLINWYNTFRNNRKLQVGKITSLITHGNLQEK